MALELRKDWACGYSSGSNGDLDLKGSQASFGVFHNNEYVGFSFFLEVVQRNGKKTVKMRSFKSESGPTGVTG